MNTQWMKKHWFKTILLAIMGVCILLVGSCAFVTRDRLVSWEEEVLLNTGETIIVKRSMPWELQGGAGNPLDIGMRPKPSQQSLQFTYKGKSYDYSGGAAVGWIVISANQTPVLVADAGSWAWARRNNYFCVTPFYVQFKPDENGKNWTWPKLIEPWLYNQSYNIMAVTPQLNENRKKRYTKQDRLIRDNTVRIQSPYLIAIDPAYKESCIEDPAISNTVKPTWNEK